MKANKEMKIRSAIAAALLALSVTGAALGVASRLSAQAASSAESPAPKGWIIGSPVIALLKRSGASEALLARAFDNPQTYIVTRPRLRNTLPDAIPTQTFTSYAALKKAFAVSAIPSTTKAILYDNERWRFTPSKEQHHPVQYATKAAALVHKHGLLLIVTPATDLAGVLLPNSGNKYHAFLSLSIIGGLAKVADVVEVQAQGAEGLGEYAAFVKAASAQAHAANPAVKFYAGMSTNPTGRLVSSQQLFKDYQATKDYVNGYWLNVPGRSPYCPTCGTHHPEVAIAFLRMLSR